MKVFEEKSAERQSLEDHKKNIERSGMPYITLTAKDEMCVNQSNIWCTADSEGTKILNKDCREPEHLILYPKAVLRLTRKLEKSSQGDLFVLDYDSSHDVNLSLFKAPTPDAITKECLANESFETWAVQTVHKISGFVHPPNDGSVRRNQFPCSNHMALTIHKLMGDTFHSLATSISATENMYSQWLTSQIYVIVSRVRCLSSLHFVGSLPQTMNAIRKVLSETHLHEDTIYKFMTRLRQQQNRKVTVNVPCSIYSRHHFEVPATENSFVYLLVSLCDRTFSTFHLADTDGSLSEALRSCNSTRDPVLIEKQPWAMGLFIWNFSSIPVRHNCSSTLHNILTSTSTNFTTLCKNMQDVLNTYFEQLCLCVTGHVICDVEERLLQYL